VLKREAIWLLGCATGAVVALAGCGGNADKDQSQAPLARQDGAPPTKQADATGSASLTGAGATFPYPLYSKWFDAYNQARQVQINYQSIGSGGGIQQLKNGTVDFGASDAPLQPSDEKAMPGAVVHIPTVAGAVALAYNVPGAPKGLKLTGEVIANIYLGNIKKWSDPKIAGLNPGSHLPDTAVVVAHRSDGSGTTSIFTNYLKAVNPEWATRVGAGKSVSWPTGVGGKGNEGVAGVVKQSPGGIGYVELAYAIQNNFSYASVRNKEGAFVEPSVASTTAAVEGALPALKKDIKSPIVNAGGSKSYPISGLTYILAYKKAKDAAKSKTLVAFLDWAIADGQKMAEPLYYAPLPAEVVNLDKTAIATIQ